MRTIIIAEAGVNHNGCIETAKKLIDVAIDAGVDYVKFQSFKAENLVSINAEKANYQKKYSDVNESQFEMLKKLELNYNEHKTLVEYCKENNIKFISSPFDLDSVDILYDLGVDFFKIGSGECNNYPLVEYIAKQKKPIILSTGMNTIKSIKPAVIIIRKYKVWILR